MPEGVALVLRLANRRWPNGIVMGGGEAGNEEGPPTASLADSFGILIKHACHRCTHHVNHFKCDKTTHKQACHLSGFS
jgi:hypothetical protein